MNEVNIKSLGILSQKIQEMIATNFYQMGEESKRIASEQQEYFAIVSDRYEQEMKKAVNNIKYEVDKADSPYLSPNVDSRGKDLAPIIDESLAIVDVSEGRNYYVEEST